MKHLKSIKYNSPVVLTFAIISALVLLVSMLTQGKSTLLLFSVYRGSLLDPLFYVRLFGHVLGHADLAHYTNGKLTNCQHFLVEFCKFHKKKI